MRDFARFRRRDVLVAMAAVATGSALAGCSPQAEERQPGAVPEIEPPPPPTVFGLAAGSVVLWCSDEELRRTLDGAAQLRAEFLRFDVSWSFAEPLKGQYEWRPSDRVVNGALERGLTPLVTITNAPTWAAVGGRRHTGRPNSPAEYAEFAGKVADRYRGSVSTFEVWNEPNGRMFFEPEPDAAVYTQMLRLAYQSIKEVDDDVIVLGGALGAAGHTPEAIAPLTFLSQMYDNGAQGSFDALSYHPYDYQAPFAIGALYATAPMNQMAAMHDIMSRNGDGDKSIWITEYGAPSGRIGDGRQANLIADSLRQWQEVSYAGPFIVHTVRDGNSSSPADEDTFGVLTDAFEPKPVFAQLQSLVADGIPRRDVDGTFRANGDPALGAAVTPVFELTGGRGQRFEQGFRFEVGGEFVSSPLDVGQVALPWRLPPSGPFTRGFQDFGADSRLRVFSHAELGTHAVFGGILDAWRPSLGFPTSDEYAVGIADGTEARIIDFEHGTITWSQAAGAKVDVR